MYIAQNKAHGGFLKNSILDGFLRKTFTLVWPVWGPVYWSHLRVKAHFQKLG